MLTEVAAQLGGQAAALEGLRSEFGARIEQGLQQGAEDNNGAVGAAEALLIGLTQRMADLEAI